MYIPNNSNSADGYCNFPHSYDAKGLTSTASQTRLCGGYSFKTKDY
jgi:hypothetical protein